MVEDHHRQCCHWWEVQNWVNSSLLKETLIWTSKLDVLQNDRWAITVVSTNSLSHFFIIPSRSTASLEISCNFKSPSIHVYFNIIINYGVCVATVVVTSSVSGLSHLFLSGADVVDWLFSRVEGFKDRRDARKYASSLLKHGYLRHTVNKITFSEQCYYTFGDLCQSTPASLKCVMQVGECADSTHCLCSFLLRHGLAQFKWGIQWRRLWAGYARTATSHQQPLAPGRPALPLPSLSLRTTELPTRVLGPMPQFPQWECGQPAQRG